MCRVRCCMKQRRDRGTSNSARHQMKVQPSPRTPIWRSMGTVGQKLRESNVCSLGEQISHRGRSLNYDVFCGAKIECETVDSRKFRW